MRLSPRSAAVTAALVVALSASARPAHAEDDPRRARAEALYGEGLKLHDADREAEALAKFKEAHAAYPSPNILVSLARTEQLLGRNLDALRHFRDALRNPLLNPNHQALVRDYVRALEGRVGRLRIEAPEGAKLAIDGQPLEGVAPLREPAEVEPGSRRVTAKVGDENVEAAVAVKAGEVTTVVLRRGAGGVTTTSAAATDVTTPPPAEPDRGDRGASAARWIVAGSLVGVGAAGLVGAAVVSGSRGADLDALRAQEKASPNVCADRSSPGCLQRQDLVDSANGKQTTAIVLGVAGGALVVGGVVALLLWPKGETHVAPYAGPGGGGAVLTHAF